MTPKPWAVVLIENNLTDFNLARSREGQSGMVYIQSAKECEYNGTLGENTSVFWCDDEATADMVVLRAQESYPKNSYAIVQTKTVSYVPASPAVRATFGPAGLLPI
jgi:hypothetical protein